MAKLNVLRTSSSAKIRRQCDNGIRALVELYGECPKEHYDPNCSACRASWFIRDMREMQKELSDEAF